MERRAEPPSAPPGASPRARGATDERSLGSSGDDLLDVVAAAREREPHAVARLVSVFEDRRPEAVATRAAVMEQLDTDTDTDAGERGDGVVVGVTGTPGSGKSSLLARVTARLVEVDDEVAVAVVAVDPSSHVSGGSLLGDRTRMRPGGAGGRVFFRSQASATELGGLSPTTFQVCRLLVRLYDAVLLETVGIGQSEADVRHLADRVYLVLQPLGGDEVQFLKAGIIEVPQAFVLNKIDEPAAARSEHHLRASLWLARPFDADEVPIHRTSALTGEGIDELVDALRDVIAAGGRDLAARAPHFLHRWVLDEWGRVGGRFLTEQLGGAGAYLDEAGGFEAAQLDFSTRLRAAEHLPPPDAPDPVTRDRGAAGPGTAGRGTTRHEEAV